MKAGNGVGMGMNTGKISEKVLQRSVLRQIKTERKEVLNGAGIGEDCAIFSFSDRYVASCMQEAAIRLKDDTEAIKYDAEPRITMTHLIKRCANNLAAAGAQPVAVMITLLLPETFEEPDLKAFMEEAEEICKELSISIAGGQTRVSDTITVPIAVVAGSGILSSFGEYTWNSTGNTGNTGHIADNAENAEHTTDNAGNAAHTTDNAENAEHGAEDVTGHVGHTSRNVAPGQDIVISKWIGLEGTSLLAHRYREELLSRFPASLVDEAACFDRYLSVLPEAAAAVEFGVCVMHDVSEGGIFAALWELAEAAGVGLTVDIKKLPLRQETVEICEYCNVNPYELLSGGSLIMTAEDGFGLAAWLKERQIPAIVVGKITDSNDRLLLNGDEVRYMDRPKRDEIYRVFHDA